MPKVALVHRVRFSAAHRLHSPHLDAQQNRETYGPCGNIHGHNYLVEVRVAGELDPRTGMIMNLVDLDSAMQEELVQAVDHRLLNEDVPFLRSLDIITAETLAIAFWERLVRREPQWGGARLTRVRVFETEDSYAEYRGEDESSSTPMLH